MANLTLVGGGVAVALLSVPFFTVPADMMGLRSLLDSVSIYDSGGLSDQLAAYCLGLILAFLGVFMLFQGLTA
ncbi:hypothetical protein [Halorientalis litorea]|jgi:hypothetical protein|uniref:hypothetical protein n=1 Tax=Halorientalis litorea TaxID=2931977 RepID=UPI001FF36B75|nr:hypothetical protein [Halorientalis litorea]